MKQFIILGFILISFNQISAQLSSQKSIDVSLGYGVAFPYEEIEVYGSGFSAQGEYVMDFSKWIGVRPYAGFILAKASEEDYDGNPTIYRCSANAFLLGTKVRFTLPIPWVAPYLEAGIGASIGSFRTFTPLHDIDKKGFALHYPISLGLQIGRHHNFDLGLSYYMMPNEEQVNAVIGIGFTIPLNNN